MRVTKISFRKLNKKVCALLIAGSSLMIVQQAQAQLKVGDNPTSINKSAILELQSTRQGFLMPRLSDTAGINALTPPDGMMIYLNSATAGDRGVYIRRNGGWSRLSTDGSASTNYWNLDGNTMTGSEKLGSINDKTLKLITNNIERLTIDGTSGDVGVSSNLAVTGNTSANNINAAGNVVAAGNVSGVDVNASGNLNATGNVNAAAANIAGRTSTNKLNVSDSVTFSGLGAGTDNDVLVINPATGAVSRRTMNADAFKSWVTSSLGSGHANGLERRAGAAGANDTLILHAATISTPGAVSAAAQTFGGDKTFNDNVQAAGKVAVGTSTAANSTLEVAGSVAMSIKTVTANHTLDATDNTLLANCSGSSITVTLPSASGVAGRIYTIKKVGNGGLDNDLTIAPASGQTIDGGSDYKIYNDWTFVTLQSDGSSWYIIKK